MRSMVAVLAVAAAVSFTSFSQAGSLVSTPVQAHMLKGGGEKHHHPMAGTISSVDATGGTVVVSVANKKGATKDHTFKTDASTKITLDGKTATLADLKQGQQVTVTLGAEKGVAGSIEATSK